MKNSMLLALILCGGLVAFQLQSQTAQDNPPKKDCSEKCEKQGQQSCSSPISIYENPQRLPLRNFVLENMGNLKGKTILDIGAGPGFFAFEMAKKADKVIATELDQQFLNYMNQKADRENWSNFEVRKANDRHTEFKGIKADYALMVYVFHYLDDPKQFLASLKPSLKPGGKLFIANAQLKPVIIKDYLERAGFTNVRHESEQLKISGCGQQSVSLISGTIPGSL